MCHVCTAGQSIMNALLTKTSATSCGHRGVSPGWKDHGSGPPLSQSWIAWKTIDKWVATNLIKLGTCTFMHKLGLSSKSLIYCIQNLHINQNMMKHKGQRIKKNVMCLQMIKFSQTNWIFSNKVINLNKEKLEVYWNFKVCNKKGQNFV